MRLQADVSFHLKTNGFDEIVNFHQLSNTLLKCWGLSSNIIVQYIPLDPKTMKNEGFRPSIYGS